MARTLAQKTATARNFAKYQLVGISGRLSQIISQGRKNPKVLSKIESDILSTIKGAIDSVVLVWRPTL